MHTIRLLYKKLLTFYPQSFKEQLAESMEQTFNDLCMEKRRTKSGLFGFVLWTFAETTIGIFRERLFLISPGDIMQTTLKTFGSSTLISFLLILPFMIMEVVNRRHFNEDFPFVLFFGLWLNLFAISLILLPILSAWRTANPDRTSPALAQGNTHLTNPNSATIMSVALVLFLAIIFLLGSAWTPLQSLFNTLNAESLQLYGVQVPSHFIALVLFSLPVLVGIMAGGPIIRTLRAGGRLYAHPIHLIIVVVVLFLFAVGVISLIVDQWPCFVGVPVCD